MALDWFDVLYGGGLLECLLRGEAAAIVCWCYARYSCYMLS